MSDSTTGQEMQSGEHYRNENICDVISNYNCHYTQTNFLDLIARDESDPHLAISYI